MGEENTKNASPGDSQFQPIWDMLRPLLASGVRNIHFWDGNHGSGVPREIFTDAKLHELVSGYGKPLYIFEEASPGINEMFAHFKTMSAPEQQQRIRQLIESVPKEIASHMRALTMLLSLNANDKAIVYDPDPRGPALLKADFTPDEMKYYLPLMKKLSESGLENIDQLIDEIRATLSLQERQNFDSFIEKFAKMASDGDGKSTLKIDETIVDNIRQFRQAQKIPDAAVQVGIYGMLHYMKAKDIDEAFSGVSIAVVDAPGAMRQIYAEQPQLLTDMPEYVWYIKEKRLVKLDNQAAIDEFRGPSVNGFLGGFLKNTITPSLSGARDSQRTPMEMQTQPDMEFPSHGLPEFKPAPAPRKGPSVG